MVHTEYVAFRCPAALRQEIEELAESWDVSVSNVLRLLLAEALKDVRTKRG